MSGPSNETEAEKLQRRQVEALERIAAALEMLPGNLCDDFGYIHVAIKDD